MQIIDIDDRAFEAEAFSAGATEATKADLVFLGAASPTSLKRIETFARRLQGAQALWIVYPKALKDITESMVLQAGRGAGLKDVKVVKFSETHTALKFVVPKAHR